MDVSSWPLDRIMQLPDWCFGKRWWIGEYLGTAAGELVYNTVHDRLPDRFVLWSMFVQGTDWNAGTGINLTVKLAERAYDGDSFWHADRLFHQIASEQYVYEFFLTMKGMFYLPYIRSVHESKNNRICVAFKIRAQETPCENQIAFLISSVPREVPDWLISGPAGSL
ncbi:unnamed protein product [marine sediment metagenome]|uniref:Uncharacterized protein n=1 Tax=marine sediment metagenome TaxID=412755 RepID=X1ITJ9_9ZZZZ